MGWFRHQVFLVCLLGPLTACGGGAAPAPGAPTGSPLVVAGDSSLGSAPIGSGGTERTWILTNAGDAPLTIERIDVVGTHAGDFNFPDASPPFSLEPSQASAVVLCFHPTAMGARVATVEIEARTGQTQAQRAVPIVGEGLAFSPPIEFVDVTLAAGIDAPHGGESLSIGQAWGDIDNDGWLDLFLTDTSGPNRLFMNQADGTFAPANQTFPDGHSAGAVFADYDNDGWIDLFVCNRFEPSVLYRNDSGTLVDVTIAAGILSLRHEKACAFGDYDDDGDLDLYVAAYDRFSPDTLYRNDGSGTFSDVTHLLPIEPVGWCFAVSFLDYDNDGDMDIYVLSDARHNPDAKEVITRNLLFRNDGASPNGWEFTEVGESAGAAGFMESMGLAIGDYDLDGALDLFISDAGPSRLLRNRGDGSFEDATAAAGADVPTFGWGTVMADFNLDGWPDIYLAASADAGNVVLRNRGDGTFADVSPESGARDLGNSYGVAYADYDRDGDVDLVVGNSGSGYRLYRNETNPPAGRWLGVRLTGSASVNRSAIGSRAVLRLDDGRVQMQEIKSGSSMGAGNDLALRFGLGTARPVSLSIEWTDGTTELIQPVPTGIEIQRTRGGP